VLGRKIWKPPIFQGTLRRRRYFEGWYYKLISADTNSRLAIIPGIYLARKRRDSYAFIQIFDGQTQQCFFQRYSLASFRAGRKHFWLRIASNYFSESRISLALEGDQIRCHGEIKMQGLHPWPVSWTSPGIMGWYRWVPFMQCYHGVISYNHTLAGKLQIGQQRHNFANGRGYSEKDWGKSFPKAWLWCQANHFATPEISITGSIAIIPWLGSAFLGFIFGLQWENRLLTFTTYNRAKLQQLYVASGESKWVLEKKPFTLLVRARAGKVGKLIAPALGGMEREIKESLDSEIELELREQIAGQDVLRLATKAYPAAFEVGGDTQQLMKMWHLNTHQEGKNDN
jgi:tocopherol cyclase